MKIYVAFKKPKTVKEFIKQFFTYTSYTIWVDGRGVETYRNKECTRLQCDPGRRRSIQDIYNCVKTYFPTVKLSTVVAEVIKLRPSNERFRCSFCPDVGRIVINWGYQMGSLPSPQSILGRTIRELGIKNAKELYDYK